MDGKTLRVFYSAKELASMMDMSYSTFKRLYGSDVRSRLGHSRYKRWNRQQVIELFRTVGFPEGYEHYERTG